MSHIKTITVLITVFIVLSGMLAVLVNMPVTQQVNNVNNTVAKTEDIGGSFTLINQEGVLTGSKAIEEEYKMVFFGFTYCPEVCPAALQKMTLVLNALGAQADKIRPVFISVDPQRDTPEVIKEYLSAFHPRLIGFTGTPEQVRNVQERYRVYVQKTQSKGATEYMVDHSGYIYLTGPDDKVIDVIRVDLDIAEISGAIAGLLD